MIDPQLFSLREQRVAEALLSQEPKWAEAVRNDGEFGTLLWHMTRTVITMLDGGAAKWAWRIEDLDLTVRAYNVLKREGIHTVGQLTRLTWADLADYRNMGIKAIENVECQLAEVGLHLKQSRPTYVEPWEPAR